MGTYELTNVSSRGLLWFCPLHWNSSWCLDFVTREDIVLSVCFASVFVVFVFATFLFIPGKWSWFRPVGWSQIHNLRIRIRFVSTKTKPKKLSQKNTLTSAWFDSPDQLILVTSHPVSPVCNPDATTTAFTQPFCLSFTKRSASVKLFWLLHSEMAARSWLIS